MKKLYVRIRIFIRWRCGLKSSKVSSELIFNFNFNLKLKLIYQGKSEFFEFFFRKTDAVRKKKTPPGPSLSEAPGCLFFFLIGLRLPKKKLRKLGFALVNQLQLQVEVEVEDQLWWNFWRFQTAPSPNKDSYLYVQLLHASRSWWDISELEVK